MSDPDAPLSSNFAGPSPITSVTFRLRPEDVRAFRSALRPRIVTAILYVVATLTVVLLITSLVLHVRRFGFNHPEVFRSGGILIFMVVVARGPSSGRSCTRGPSRRSRSRWISRPRA